MRLALLLLLALAATPADARWVVRYDWVEPIIPFYSPVLLHGRAAWGDKPAWCNHGKHWSCRP